MEFNKNRCGDNFKKLAAMKPEDWQKQLLDLNPDYIGFDMPDQPLRVHAADLENYLREEQNMVVGGFEFVLTCESEDCEDCGGSGLSPAAKKISESFSTGYGNWKGGWGYKLDEEDVKVLLDHHRLGELSRYKDENGVWQRRPNGWVPTVDEVNAHFRSSRMGHDGINEYVLKNARYEREGIDPECSTCNGLREIPKLGGEASVMLNLWVADLGASEMKYVEVEGISKDNVLSVVSSLRNDYLRRESRCALQIAALSNPKDDWALGISKSFPVIWKRENCESADLASVAAPGGLDNSNLLADVGFERVEDGVVINKFRLTPRKNRFWLQETEIKTSAELKSLVPLMEKHRSELHTRYAPVERCWEVMSLLKRQGVKENPVRAKRSGR